jgi:FAD/FMN-containing dehydrogenase
LTGGISPLAKKHGFAADSIVSFELLTANGTLVDVAQASNPDLFYTLKAGSTNFGIATRSTLAVYPLSKVWGGTLVYTNEHRNSIMRAIAQYPTYWPTRH